MGSVAPESLGIFDRLLVQLLVLFEVCEVGLAVLAGERSRLAAKFPMCRVRQDFLPRVIHINVWRATREDLLKECFRNVVGGHGMGLGNAVDGRHFLFGHVCRCCVVFAGVLSSPVQWDGINEGFWREWGVLVVCARWWLNGNSFKKGRESWYKRD